MITLNGGDVKNLNKILIKLKKISTPLPLFVTLYAEPKTRFLKMIRTAEVTMLMIVIIIKLIIIHHSNKKFKLLKFGIFYVTFNKTVYKIPYQYTKKEEYLYTSMIFLINEGVLKMDAETKEVKKFKTTVFFISCALSLIVGFFVLLKYTNLIIFISLFLTVLLLLVQTKINIKKIIGGYLMAGLVGYVFSIIPVFTTFNLGFGLVASILAMDYLKFQHAPALGFVISIILNKSSFFADTIIILSLLIIVGVILALKKYYVAPEKAFDFVTIETEKINWNL